MTSQVSQHEELTEEELLGGATDIHLDHDFDEDALLADDPPVDTGVKNIDKLPVEEKTQESEVDKEESHHEELDYDDDDDDAEEDRETRSKFTSERAKIITSSSGVGTSISSSSVSSNNSARFRDSQNKGRNIPNKNLPSLLGMEVKPPPILPGGKILVNPNFRPQQPPMVRLTLPGAPTITMPPPMPTMPMGPIMPRLPNGTPLLPYPPNHGIAGFGPSPPMPFPPMMGGPTGQWDHRVAAFLTNVAGRRGGERRGRRRSRSSSYSSRSSSSRSSRSRSRSRSSSRSPRRRRRSSSHRRNRRRSSDRRRDRRDRDSRRYHRDSRNSRNGNRADRSKSDKEVAEECAKAVGVDNDYLSKVEEQRKRREELVRKKEQRRYGGNEDIKTEEKKKTAEDDRKKAYLCVTIKNMTHLPSAPARIEKLASDIGNVTKCWRFNEDQVNLIFKDHSNAKDFLLKYNNKVLSGLRMQVTLEKAYFNLSEIN